jgi:dipeptidyl-peptidase 4
VRRGFASHDLLMYARASSQDQKILMARILGLFLLLALALPTAGNAQTANFELAERFTTQKMNKMLGSLSVRPRWLEGESRFWYEYETPDGANWSMVDAARKTKRDLFDRDALAAQLSEHFRRPFNALNLDLDDFEYDTGKGLFTFHVDSIGFEYRFESRELVAGDSIPEEDPMRWATYSADSTWIAFSRTHNLYLMRGDDPDSTEYQLTTDGEQWYSYQGDDSDTTSTKRLRSRANWFEDEQKLYVRRQDRREVEDLWVINSLGDRPTLETYKYPMPGDEKVPQDEVWIFDVSSADSTIDSPAGGLRLDTDKWKDQSLGGVYFNKGGFFETETSDYLYFLRRDRPWQNVDVCRANTTTGEVEVLWSEESKPYHNTRYMDLVVINEGEEYLWFSERTGWGQLYRYDADGNLKNRVTEGYFTVGDIERVDTTAQVIYFEGWGREDGVNPYYAMKYRINFDGSGMKLLTPEAANHSFSMSDNHDFWVDNYSTVADAPKSVLRNRQGQVVLELEDSDLSPIVEAGWQAPETFSVKAADGQTDLWGVMWKPFDFDPEKTYPVISYVYPGPQTEPFPVGFSTSGRQVPLAQVGFVVVAFGNRGGSPMRSKYYHNFGYGNLRDYPLADNRYGLEQLAARNSFIDISRVGIYGHSGGGFMSTAALLSHPDFYDVAVSSAGNHDNNIYNMWWSEVHDGVESKTVTKKVEDEDDEGEELQEEEEEQELEQEEVDGDEEEEEVTTFSAHIDTNPSLAENLEGHLLLVHGDVDNNVHPANTIRLVNALIKAGKRFDFMLMPGKRHGFGSMTPYFERMTWYYFAEHLLGDYRTNVNFNIPDDDD